MHTDENALDDSRNPRITHNQQMEIAYNRLEIDNNLARAISYENRFPAIENIQIIWGYKKLPTRF